jgi:peptidoglycan hydrolase-like protein with peptidoglycan-binding domain
VRSKHRLLVVAAAASVIGGAVAVGLVATQRKPAAAAKVAGPSALVTRRDLADTQDFDATLGYADTRPVATPVGGTVTQVVVSGGLVRPGATLYALSGAPVLLLDGPTPAWRPLGEGMTEGADVKELERNLVRLGFDPARAIVVDGRFTAATRAAVEALQRRHGLPPTGTLAVGDVVFLAGPRRVTGVAVHAGDPVAAGATLLTTSSTSRVATITVDTTQRALLIVGHRVDVVLPDSRIVSGKIASVGSTAIPEQQQGASQSQSPPSSTVDATVSLPASIDEPDGTPLTVRVAIDVRRGALSVPVTALLATSGGGRSLEVIRPDGSTTIVPVRTGLYAGGYVEVSGRGIRPGVRVLEAPS